MTFCPRSGELRGAPPRSALLRGWSIDSVDRPFHPSEWVDVNLEAPCAALPRTNELLASLSASANQRLLGSLPQPPGMTT